MLGLCLPSFAQHMGISNMIPPTDNPLRSHLDSVVHQGAAQYMIHPNAVGLSIGIYKNGTRHTYNYGEVRKGTGLLPGADNFYNLGSVAKTFVTTLLAQAVVEKKASLGDDIRKYLPGEYPNLSYQGQPVRLVHLANHTSGLPTSARSYPAVVRDSLSRLDVRSQILFYNRYIQDSLLPDMHHFRLDTLPGAAYKYNGNAMMVLMLLLERIYGQPYEQIITHYLWTRLGMYNTKTQLSPADLKRTAQGYDQHNQAQPYLTFTGFLGGKHECYSQRSAYLPTSQRNGE